MIPKHEAFCIKYIQNSGNATDAYIAAGYKCSANTAKANAARLLKRPEIQTNIQLLTEEALKKEEITIKDIVNELKKIAFCDHQLLFNEKGEPKSYNELPPDCIAAMDMFDLKRSVDGSYNLKVKFQDKIKALELLARYIGMFDKNKNDTNDNKWEITINKTYDPNEFNKSYYDNN